MREMQETEQAQERYIAGMEEATVSKTDDGVTVRVVFPSTFRMQSLGSIRQYRDWAISKAAAAVWREVVRGNIDPVQRGRVLTVTGAARVNVQTYALATDGTGIPDWVSAYGRDEETMYWWVSDWDIEYKWSNDPAALQAYGQDGVKAGLDG